MTPYWTTQKIYDILSASKLIHNTNIPQQHLVSGFHIDTRTIKPNQVFVALQTKTNDGHKFLQQAVTKSASAAIVEKNNAYLQQWDIPQNFPLFYTSDSLNALNQLANSYRQLLTATVIAITGSNGKTSVSQFLQRMLRALTSEKEVSGSIDSWNNHLGVPLTILNTDANTRYLVIEMGMNHPGEIQQLSLMAQPHHAIITNVSAAHHEHFHSIHEIAKAKLEVISGLHANKQATRCVLPSLTFHSKSPGLSLAIKKCLKENILLDVHESSADGFDEQNVALHKQISKRTHLKYIDRQSNGIHFAIDNKTSKKSILAKSLCNKVYLTNLAAVFNVLYRIGFSQKQIQEACQKVDFSSVPGRYNIIHLPKSRILIDDSYNANPHSFITAIQELREMQPNQKIALFAGEMKELGAYAKVAHQKIAQLVANLDYTLFATSGGDLAKMMSKISKRNNKRIFSIYSDNPITLYELVKEQAGDILDSCSGILVKGSRIAKMELLVEKISKNA